MQACIFLVHERVIILRYGNRNVALRSYFISISSVMNKGQVYCVMSLYNSPAPKCFISSLPLQFSELGGGDSECVMTQFVVTANLPYIVYITFVTNETTGPTGRTMGALTHWGRVTHICVGKMTIIGSDNGLSPERRQAIILTNAGILLIGPLGTDFSEILIAIETFSFKKMHLKISSAKWRPFCLGLNVLTDKLCLSLTFPSHQIKVIYTAFHHQGSLLLIRVNFNPNMGK